MGVLSNSDNNRNGRTMNIEVNNSLIGQPDQKNTPYESFSTGEKMRMSTQESRFFPEGKGNTSGGGTINKNGEYGPITYGF